MKVLILEDELITAEGLAFKLMTIRPQIQVVAILASVREAVEWFGNGNVADLAFFDIHLADGLSFEVFQQVEVGCPVVFTTAYDQYALQAFDVFSVAYLLKPIDRLSLQKALDKLDLLQGQHGSNIPSNLVEGFLKEENISTYKQRFMTRVGDRLLAFGIGEVSHFMADDKVVWMKLDNKRRYPIDYKMDELEVQLNPKDFFRVNRTYIIAFRSIKEVYLYSSSRLRVELETAEESEEIIVSRDRVEGFRQWFGK